ncbi:hypothetical protein L1887_06839 [Cichorium endivia]|nr:hypothetical protein L1887_06839 [Cichorium endivia]
MNHGRNSIPNFTTLRQSKLIIFPVLSLSPSPFLNFPCSLHSPFSFIIFRFKCVCFRVLALFANNCSEISNIRSNIINRNYDESRS